MNVKHLVVMSAMSVVSGCASLRDLPPHEYEAPCRVDNVHLTLETPQAVNAGCSVKAANDSGSYEIKDGEQVVGCYVISGPEGQERVDVTLTDSGHVWEHELRHVFNYFCSPARLAKERAAAMSPLEKAYAANPCAAYDGGLCPSDWKGAQ
jgi:hypothetical protein